MGEADGPTDEDRPETDESSADQEPAQTDSSGERTSRTQREREFVTRDELRDLQRELEELGTDVEERTVHRKQLEGDLKQYVRRRIRRGHATGWGPYLVLLYGTVMTLGAFYFLDGGWAVLAMIVVWLSTLGLYVLMLLVGVGLTAFGVPGRVLDRLRNLRK